jgi:CheY-like chemotaxis protein
MNIASQSDASVTVAPQPAHSSEVLFVGLTDGTGQEVAEGAARRAGASASFCWDADEARELLGDPAQAVPRCVFLDEQVPSLDHFVAWMRGEGRMFPVPIVAQTSDASDAGFLCVHAMGADDALVRGDAAGVHRRIANLSGFDPSARPPLTQGRAVVAHGDETRRRVLGRILRQAGFDVSFALHDEDLVENLKSGQGEAPSVLVVHADWPTGKAAQTVHAIRALPACAKMPIVLLAPREAHEALEQEVASAGAVALAVEGAPPDNLLFLANELLRPDVQNVRASKRLLYGTVCGFRVAGALTPVYGLTYNISREGLYVRTLDPPPPGAQVWFELRPPGRDEAVHLRGKVVWCRGLRNPGGAAPPGFGLRISDDDSPPGDLAAYVEAYERLL